MGRNRRGAAGDVRRWAGALALATAVATVLAGPALAGCPSEDEAKKAVIAWNERMSVDPNGAWKIVALEDFSFGPMQFGSENLRDIGLAGPTLVCPIRFDVSYAEVDANGKRRPIERKNLTYYFYPDEFGWGYKTGL